MNRLKILIAALSLCLAGGTVSAQTGAFRTAKSLDMQYSILKELSHSYVDSIKIDRMVYAGITAMLGELDPYTVYIDEEEDDDYELLLNGTYGGVGAVVRKVVDSAVVITQPYENSPAAKASLVPCDRIIAIDGTTVFGETSAQSTSRMKGQPGTEVVFKVVKMRSGDTTDVTVTRERIRRSSIDYSCVIRDSIGYVALSGFTTGTADEMRRELMNLKSSGARRLVIDLRDNGGGSINEAIGILSLILPKNTLCVTSRGRAEEREYRTEGTPVDTLMPVMVMINSSSASASEIVAGAVQDLDRGAVAGKRSFGKGLVQTIVPMPFGSSLKYTIAKYYTPSGRCVQAIDYSHRNEDGSVGYIADSLTHEFSTRLGRTVRDGGGITPDFVVDQHTYSRTSFAVVYSGIVEDFALDYFRRHESIAPYDEFYLSDNGYEEFVQFAAVREFDARSASQVQYDRLIEAAKEDGLYDGFKQELDRLGEKVNMDKATLLRAIKPEMKAIVESEIVTKYWFEKAGFAVELRDDIQLYRALDLWDRQ